ncbi:MAG: SDR family oxidoreductase [Pseudonocardiales bacterium]|nr:SDR family oxidoreductase [Pseudonocardiales bacterium]
MRVAVIGGTGLVGRHTTKALRDAGHDVVVVARSTGVDLATGAGLDAELAGITAVIDVTNTAVPDAEAARELFGTTTGNLLAAEQRAGVGHHVVLSIVSVDRIAGNAHYAGKRRQEELVAGGPIPATILRATQFHEFAAMVVDWTQRGDVATVPPLLLQPVAASDVGQVLAEIATGPPQGRARDLAGPETQDLVDMARRTLAARGRSVRLAPSWRGGLFSVDMAGEVLLPGPDAQLAPTTFDTWLAGEAESTACHGRELDSADVRAEKRRCGRVHDVDRRGGSVGVGGG